MIGRCKTGVEAPGKSKSGIHHSRRDSSVLLRDKKANDYLQQSWHCSSGLMEANEE